MGTFSLDDGESVAIVAVTCSSRQECTAVQPSREEEEEAEEANVRRVVAGFGRVEDA